MIPLALGVLALAGLLWAGRAFAGAQVVTLKALAVWAAWIGGAVLLVLLLLTGRGMMAIPLLALGATYGAQALQARRGLGGSRTASPPQGAAMSRAEALQVLGLRDGADRAAVLAAWKRVMQGAHPDHGGSDWLAARVNQARDVLLSRRH